MSQPLSAAELEIKNLIQRDKLIDLTEIGDLERMLEKSRVGVVNYWECRQCGSMRAISATIPPSHHEAAILAKILSWIK